MQQFQSVVRMFVPEYLVLSLIGPAHIHLGSVCVMGNLVPDTLYSVSGRRGIVEVRVGEVESHVLYSHHDSASGVWLWQCAALVYGYGVELYCHGIHVHRVAAVGFYALHFFGVGKHVKPVERYVGYAYVALLCQQTATIGGQQAVGIARYADEGA